MAKITLDEKGMEFDRKWFPSWFPHPMSPARDKAIHFFSKILAVANPAQYLGDEYQSVQKDLAKMEVRIALSYPDLYEIGMANRGIALLYEAVNRLDFAYAERVFAPWLDMEKLLRSENYKLFTLESATPVALMDIWGFNLNHELLISNVLLMLDLAGLPLLVEQRSEEDPIIIFAGSASSNPEPLRRFADLFFIGEGEDAILEICNIVRDSKKRKLSRKARIQRLSEIIGLGHPNIDNNRIAKRYITNPQMHLIEKPILSNIKISQNRMVVELARGCGWGCRFCQAGFIKRPLRNFRNVDADAIVQKTKEAGWEEISLNALSIGDFPGLADLIDSLTEKAYPAGISISLPSLRIDNESADIIEITGGVRKSSLTFALESGSSYIRNVIRKNIVEEDLYKMSYIFYRRGWDIIKIYFMLGLPNFHNIDEAGEIIRVLDNMSKLASAVSPRKRVHVTVSPFVPKAHTPFQWVAMQSMEYFETSLRRIRAQVSKRVQVKYHDPKMSILESALSRGDQSVGSAIEKAYQDGCRFDGWSETFHYSLWQKAFEDSGLNLLYIASRGFDITEPLPWQYIEAAHQKQLQYDYLKSKKISMENNHKDPDQDIIMGIIEHQKRQIGGKSRRNNPETTLGLEERQLIEKKWIISFSKQGVLRFISHLDYLELVKSVLRRAGLPLTLSQGFHSREKITLPPALSLGISSMAEPFLISFFSNQDLATDEVRQKIQSQLPLQNRVGKIYPWEGKLIFDNVTYYIYLQEKIFENTDQQWLYESFSQFIKTGEYHKEKKSSGMKHGKRNRTIQSSIQTLKKIIEAVLETNIERSLASFQKPFAEFKIKLNDQNAIGIAAMLNLYTMQTWDLPWHRCFFVERIALNGETFI